MHGEGKENPDVEDIRAKRKTYKRRTGRNITNFQGAVKGREEKFLFMRIFVLAHISAVAQEGSQEGGSILPDTLPVHEQKIDHGAPDAKRRHHFREVTKKVISPPPYPSPTTTLHLPHPLPYTSPASSENIARAYTLCEDENED